MFVTSSRVTPRGGRRHIVTTMLSLTCIKGTTMHSQCSTWHMHSRRAERRLTPSSTCTAGEQSKDSLHPAHVQPESRAKAHSIQHMHSRRAEQRLTPSSTCTAGEQSKGSLHPAHVHARTLYKTIQLLIMENEMPRARNMNR